MKVFFRKKTQKYNNKRTKIDGITFSSKLEADYYLELKTRQKEGDVLFFLRQVPFDLGGGVKYFLDFLVFHKNGEVECIDTKGYETSVYRIKKKLVESRYPLVITEVKKSNRL